MPCSCRKSSALKTAYTTPSNNQPSYSTNVTVRAQMGQQEASDSYSFGATTKPDQLCLNCIAKHVGLAYQFLSQPMPQRLIAAGELICASNHAAALKPGIADFFRNLAIRIVRNPSEEDYKEELQKCLNTLYEEGQLPTAQGLDLKDRFEDGLIRLLTAYSMLFVEVLYEKVNLPWVVSNIAFVANRQFSASRNIEDFTKFRELWKTIQSIQGYNDVYYKAKEDLWTFVEKSWKKYTQQRQIEAKAMAKNKGS